MQVALVDLNLDNNRLQSVNRDLRLCTRLKHLSLRNNRLCRFVTSAGDAVSDEADYAAGVGGDVDGGGEGEGGGGGKGEPPIPAEIFTETKLQDMGLQGNPSLTVAVVSSWLGVSVFLERRRRMRERHGQEGRGGSANGGTAGTGAVGGGDEMNLFGC